MQSKSEVGHFGIFVLRDEHISGGEVTMNHMARFKVLHTLAGIPEKYSQIQCENTKYVNS